MKPGDEDGIDQRLAALLQLTDRERVPVDEGFLERLAGESADAFRAASAAASRRIRFTILRSRMRWVSAPAAAAAALLILGLWSFTGTGPEARSYAIADVPRVLKAAKTLHWKEVVAYAFGEADKRRFEHTTTETWMDFETGRFHEVTKGTAKRDDGRLVNDVEVVFNGEHAVGIYHSDRTVSFFKWSDFGRRVNARRNRCELLRRFYVGDREQLSTFGKIGGEVIDRVKYDLWVGTVPRPSSDDGPLTVNAWLLPRTGDLAKVEVRALSGRMGFIRGMLEVVERDVPIPPERFDLKIPRGYFLTNTMETAETQRFSNGFAEYGGSVSFSLDVGLTLEDGTLILGWHSKDERWQEALFAGLTVGGPLPALPLAAIESIKTIGVDKEVEYVGRHLAYTRDGKDFYEWSLHVPRKQPPARSRFFGYAIRYSGQPVSTGPRSVDYQSDLLVAPEDFDLLVRGAMAEYSQDGTAPQHVTRDAVMKLAGEVRRSMEEDR